MDKALVNQFQPSLSEWFVAMGDKDLSDAVRNEDNSRSERFDTLHDLIGLPIDKPDVFEARELFEKSSAFAAVLAERGDKPCAIRLVPKKEGLPKLRNRGMLLKDCYEQWFLKQEVNAVDYLAEVYKHSNTQAWAATFVVGDNGIVGEIVEGVHTQLTQGEVVTPIYRFLYNFSTWEWSEDTAEAKAQVERMLAPLVITDPVKQKAVQEKLNGSFIGNYLKGYFETTVWGDGTLYFIDYNRLLSHHIVVPAHITEATEVAVTLRGSVAFPGEVTGVARVVLPEAIASVVFNDGDILVCDNTDVRYLPLMKRAGAIVTERGGILSHAAIIARELKKPCIIGAQKAVSTLQTGQTVQVDANRGIVTILSF